MTTLCLQLIGSQVMDVNKIVVVSCTLLSTVHLDTLAIIIILLHVAIIMMIATVF